MSKRGLLRVVGAPAAILLAFIAVGIAANDYWRYVLSLTASAIVVGTALTMLVSFARCISLATGSFQAIGAYSAALLTIHFAWPFPIVLLTAGFLGAVAGGLLAIPAVRFRSHNLAMVTLVFQAIAIIGLRELKSLTGGAEGLSVPAPTILGVEIQSDIAYLVMASVCCAIILVPLIGFLSGPFGKNLRALAANEVGARAFGIRAESYLIVAFVVSSAAIAMATAVIAPRLRIIDPESFGLHASIMTLAYPIVGGMGSVWGGALGGGLLRVLPELLRPIAGFIELILSSIVILTILFFRGGLIDMLTHLKALALLSRRSDARAGVQARKACERERHPVEPPVQMKPSVRQTEALVASDIVKRYDALTAVDHVSFRVKSGSIHGIMGPNGAGKTTLFNTISGFVQPDNGVIQLFGADVSSGRMESRIDLGITRTFQNIAIFPALTCRENVIIGLGRNGVISSLQRSVDWTLNGKASREEDKRAEWALNAVGLGTLVDTRADKLSLGDQRRLEIARAIVSRPRLILLDEPVSGVSHQEVEQIVDLLKTLNRDLGATMLVVEHNIGFLVSLCDELSVMASGRMIAEGPPAEVIARKDVRQTYFGETEEAA